MKITLFPLVQCGRIYGDAQRVIWVLSYIWQIVLTDEGSPRFFWTSGGTVVEYGGNEN